MGHSNPNSDFFLFFLALKCNLYELNDRRIHVGFAYEPTGLKHRLQLGLAGFDPSDKEFVCPKHEDGSNRAKWSIVRTNQMFVRFFLNGRSRPLCCWKQQQRLLYRLYHNNCMRNQCDQIGQFL